MKRLFITLLTVGALVSCSETNTNNTTKDPIEKPVKIDPNAILLVNSNTTKADENGLETAEYIVRESAFLSRAFLKEDGSLDLVGKIDLGIHEDNYSGSRDLENFRFKFSGFDVIENDTTLGNFFMRIDVCFSVALVNGVRVHPKEILSALRANNLGLGDIVEDTIAYIPNSVAESCKTKIREAFAAGNFEEVYRIFENDYHFLPIENGAAWRKLKAEGIE